MDKRKMMLNGEKEKRFKKMNLDVVGWVGVNTLLKVNQVECHIPNNQ